MRKRAINEANMVLYGYG